MSNSEHCPCCSDKDFEVCCGPFLIGDATPQTPEQLMRSRYSAYTRADIDYVFSTMTGKALKEADRDASREWAEGCEWLGLEILDAPKPGEHEGFVEFVASYKEKGTVTRLHERSRFVREKERWYYIDGKFPENKPVTVENKVGRNEPCPCGSGRKFKKCCGGTSSQ